MQTIKQIADNSGVSKTTVKRHLKRIEETSGTEYIQQNTQTEPNGVILISEELAKKLHESITGAEQTATQDRNAPEHVPERSETDRNAKPERTATCTGTECNAPQHVPEHTATHTATECNATPETIAALNRIIEMQQAHIEQLQQDKLDLKEQLAVKDNQIEQLNILLSQQQQLQQTLQVKLLETEAGTEQTENEETEKKNGFSLFRRRKKK